MLCLAVSSGDCGGLCSPYIKCFQSVLACQRCVLYKLSLITDVGDVSFKDFTGKTTTRKSKRKNL